MTKLLAFWQLAFLLFTGFQGDRLDEKVSVDFKQIPLQQVLQSLHNAHGLNFSYGDQIIPLQTRIDLSLQNQPLKVVMERICQQSNIRYQVIGSQLVLTPAPQKEPEPKKNVVLPGKQPEEATDKVENKTESSQNKEQVTASTVPMPIQDSVYHAEEKPESGFEEVFTESENKNETDSELRSVETESKADDDTETTTQQRPKVQRQRSTKQVTESSGHNYEVRPLQVGFVYPLSTNGMEAGQVVNNISFGVLGNYSAGLDGVEFSGFANVENDFVKGIQFAGFTNLVKNKVEGVQFGGFLNLVGGNVEGGQFAGFTNINTGYTKGAQFAGFANIVTDSSLAFQAAGFGNFNTLESKGLQVAGFINTSSKHQGSQIAGFTNVSRGDVTGFQLAGFLNVARKVTGSQISVFNYADSVTGVPIGFLSIVKHGYHHLEVWGSESMHTNLAFKIGVERFYNIFAGGVHLDPDNFHWGFGYGIGSQLDLSRRFKMNFDAISMTLFSERNKIRNWDYLNLHNQFRVLFGWELASHFSLYFGPTFNVLISDAALNPENNTDLTIAPYTFYDRTYNNTNVKMWAGMNFGIRF